MNSKFQLVEEAASIEEQLSGVITSPTDPVLSGVTFETLKVIFDHSKFFLFLEGNQNKNNCPVRNLYNKLKIPALFPHLLRTEKSAGNFNFL